MIIRFIKTTMFEILEAIPFLRFICLVFLAILFLQSGLDKIFDYPGNKQWLQSHFSKSPLKNMVGFLLPVITILETAAGILCAIGLIQYIVNGANSIGLLGAQLSALAIVFLFFGQRVAKDYAGAASLVGYFMVCLISIYLIQL